MKSKKMVPDIRFKGFTGNWEEKEIKDIANINPSSELPKEFKYVDLESVAGTSLIGYRVEKKETAPSRAQRLAKNGDIFYQTVRPYQRNNFLYNLNDDNFVFSTGYAQLRTEINNKFLFTKLQENNFVNDVLIRCTGTSYPAINSTDLGEIRISLPLEYREQEKIGGFFTKLDNIIELCEEELENYKEYKKAMLQKMFPKQGEKIPEIRFAGFDGNWEEKNLREIAFINKGIQRGKDIISKYPNDIDIYPVYNGGQDKSGYTNKYNRENSITVSEGGNSAGYVNYINGKFWSGGHNYTIECNNSDKRYIKSVLDNKQNELYTLRVGSGLPNIQKKELNEFKIKLPSLPEQEKIGTFFKNLDSIIEKQEEQLENYKNLKKSMLQKMFV